MQTGFVIDDEAIKAGEKLFRQSCGFSGAASDYKHMPDTDIPEIAFAGRSNVGKSSLINALTGVNGLARASNTPGRTQQINFFSLGGQMHIVDLPGYGYAVASKDKIDAWNVLMQAYLSRRRNLKRVCILIDARHGIKKADEEAMRFLDDSGVPYLVVLTKLDKLKGLQATTVLADVETRLRDFRGAFPVAYGTSSEKGGGIPALRAILCKLMAL